MRILEWLVLLPLWRRLITSPGGRVAAATGTGVVWIVLIIIIATSGGGDDDSDTTVQGQETPINAIPATATPESTVAPVPTPEATPTPIPEPTPEPTPEPAPAGPATTFGDGLFIIGEDIVPGTYRNSSSSNGCFWERLSGFTGELDDTITNSFTTILQIVTILQTDVGFSSDDCGTWSQDLSPITADPNAPFGDGIYQVGIEIAPGTWRNEASSGCFWSRLSGFSGDIDDTITNEFSDVQQIVTIQASDIGFQSEDCGTWSQIQ